MQQDDETLVTGEKIKRELNSNEKAIGKDLDEINIQSKKS